MLAKLVADVINGDVVMSPWVEKPSRSRDGEVTKVRNVKKILVDLREPKRYSFSLALRFRRRKGEVQKRPGSGKTWTQGRTGEEREEARGVEAEREAWREEEVTTDDILTRIERPGSIRIPNGYDKREGLDLHVRALRAQGHSIIVDSAFEYGQHERKEVVIHHYKTCRICSGGIF